MDLDRCLQRIDYRGSLEPTLDTLTGLQRQFLNRVPFENLDIHLERTITLSLERSFEKIVEDGRGGFCYECNNLFHAMLTEMGFNVAIHGAKMLIENTLPLEHGHMVLSVQLQDRGWLVDVGNGQSCREPLPIDGGNSVFSEDVEYRIQPYDKGYALFYRDEDDAWKPRFRFTAEPESLEVFSEPCRIQQTSPQSRFTRHCLASIALPDGRITLLDDELTRSREGNNETVRVSNEKDYGRILAEYFGIHLPYNDIQTLFSRIQE